ncbi:unnamed protein product [Rotaria socialis]|uniref:Protein kinase domain-containing protein n=1 Tax=Rotaria socialis TaxID=392032 RepID=A0A818C4T6_9BILA|nr:unnamed protein product [Rotaria socialis]
MATGDNVFSETVAQLQFRLKIEETKARQEEAKAKQEEQKTKQKELRQKRKRPSTEEIEGSKRTHILAGQSSSSIKAVTAAFHNPGFFNIHANDHIQDLDMETLLNDNIHIKDDMMSVIEKCFGPWKSCGKANEDRIQEAVDDSINAALHKIAHLTSLKYLSTPQCRYLDGKAPDCGFVFKNINITKENQKQVLTDFIVCAGELKKPGVYIGLKGVVEQISRYLYYVLIQQKREKIYGFLTNTQQIKFYCLKKVEGLDLCDYYESKPFHFYTAVPKTSSSSSSHNVRQTTNEKSNEICWNTDTLKIFMKFLTKDWHFYGYSMLNINQNTNVNTGTKRCAIKISKRNEYSDYFKNEVKMLRQLKQSEDSINFKKYFENIFASSPTGNFIIFENYLTRLESLTLIQSQQLINIIEYLYNCRILHRDLRPDNLMLDLNQEHIKLIDFGFATTYETDEMPKALPIEGAISYAGLTFLIYYLGLLSSDSDTFDYEYERTFDLQCAINIMMYMTDKSIRATMISVKEVLSVKNKVSKLFDFWNGIKRTDENYCKLLKLIKSFTQSPNFDGIKHEIGKRFAS